MQNISGRYEIQILRHETGELETVHEQDNLITDYGLNFFGVNSKTITTKSEWDLNRCAVWLKDFPDPTTSLTEKFLPYKSTPSFEDKHYFKHGDSERDYNNSYYDDGEICYAETTRSYRFGQGYIVGDVYGVYLGCLDLYDTNSYKYVVNSNREETYPWSPNDNNYQNIYDHVYSIFSAIRLKNPDGSQKIIKVNKLDQLYIRYTLRKYMPKYVSAKSTVINTSRGTRHTVTVQPQWWERNYAPTAGNQSYPINTFQKITNNYVYTNLSAEIRIQDINGSEFFSRPYSYDNYSSSASPYVNNSYRQRFNYYINFYTANKNISYVYLGSNFGVMQLKIDPPIEKTDERDFSLSLEWSWGRDGDLYINRDSLVVVNNNFTDPDLSAWNLNKPTMQTVTERGDKKALTFLSNVQNDTATATTSVDLSAFDLTNTLLNIMWKQSGYGEAVQDVKLTYKAENGDVLATKNLDIPNQGDTDNVTFISNYAITDTPIAALTAATVEITFVQRVYKFPVNVSAITDIKVKLTNNTPTAMV